MELRNSIESRLLGKSQAIREIREKIRRVTPYDYPVLINGETGVGKSLVAELIHEFSHRASKEFIHINCSNISPELFESELFGHEKGAFTGAVERKRGMLEVADGGTVFLDEIGDLQLNNQAKLLLFMDRGIFYRLGGTQKLRADVRIIAATNNNISNEVFQGRFRQDLYYRISAINIYVPPLRERKEDIPLLAEEIISRECNRIGINKSLDPEALNKLVAHHWPGNARKLENVQKKELKVFVTGISRRLNFQGESSYLSDLRKEIIASIDELCNYAKDADIKILLFNSDLSILEEVLGKAKIKFDLAVCQSSPYSIPNKTVSLNGIPVVYPDRYGRSLANIAVYNTRQKSFFGVEYTRLYSKVPRDPQIDEELARTMQY